MLDGQICISKSREQLRDKISSGLDVLAEREMMVKDLVNFLEELGTEFDIHLIENIAHEKIKGILDMPGMLPGQSLQEIEKVLAVCRKLKVLSKALSEDLRFLTSGENQQVEVMEMLLQDFFRSFKEWQKKFPQPHGQTGESAHFLRGLSSSLMEMTAQMNERSIPWLSCTEVSHMTSVYQLASLLGEIVGLFYHQTNAAREGGPVTTELEEKVINKIGVMIGYNEGAYGYMTHGGTHANKSALIAARKVFYRPLICRQALERLNQDYGLAIDFSVTTNSGGQKQFSLLTEDELLQLSPDNKVAINQTLGAEARKQGRFDELQKLQMELEEELPGIQSRLLDRITFVVPKGINHHSIKTTIESIGFGARNIVEVPTREDSFQVDYDQLEQTMSGLNEEGKIVMGYLDVIGSTGFGSMTNTGKILEIRKKCEQKDFSFNIHIDGAYGGPLISMFRQSDGTMMTLEQARERYCSQEQGFSPELLGELYETYSHLREVDSVTIDLHKSMFGVYSGGGGSIMWKNRAVKEIISKFPPYYGDRENGEPYAFSRLDGCTFPGSAATAAHLSIQNVGLDQNGLGKYHAESIKSCDRIYERLNGMEFQDGMGAIYDLKVLNQPQIHIFNFVISPRTASPLDRDLVNWISQSLVGFMRQSETGRSFGLSMNELGGVKYVRVTTMNPFALQGELLDEFVAKIRMFMSTVGKNTVDSSQQE
jgi:glutamate/tyrosine decarboxylase-like PLP-dependent enzyme